MPADRPGFPAPRQGGLAVRPGLVLPESELEVRASRSGGPGGQNVNKVSTRVELRFDVRSSGVLTEEEKHRVRVRLAGRVSREGVLRVVSQRERSQARNLSVARRRLAELLGAALEIPKKRRPTRPHRTAQERRLQEKRRRSDAKLHRQRPREGD